MFVFYKLLAVKEFKGGFLRICLLQSTWAHENTTIFVYIGGNRGV